MASYADGDDDQYPDGYEFGSAPKYQQFEGETEGVAGGEERPKILLMGLRRSGKSSIQKVVFHKMSPNETLFLEATNKIQKDDVSNSSFVQFSIWDFPGQVDFLPPLLILLLLVLLLLLLVLLLIILVLLLLLLVLLLLLLVLLLILLVLLLDLKGSSKTISIGLL